MKYRSCLRVFLALSLATLLAGCTLNKKKQLEKVAKDWCLVIRASQVIPVYPLTEDIQPGDIFLVEVPISRQVELYDRNGFMALDNLIGRIDPDKYKEFYDTSFEVDVTGAKLVPKYWLDLPDAKKGWKDAPRAAFPSYSFAITKSTGFNAAIPVSGVPVGMSYLNTRSARASVVISEAFTYGIDTISMYAQVKLWAAQNQGFLAHFAPEGEGDEATAFVRVVTRVYLTKKLDVSMQDTSSRGAGVSAGNVKPVDMAAPQQSEDSSTDAAANYTATLKALNDSITTDPTKKGANLRIVAVSSRSVSMSETFDRPLAIGYLGFDLAIGPAGTVGPPIATFQLLNGESHPITTVDFTDTQEQILQARLKVEAAEDPNAAFERAMTALGEEWLGIYQNCKDIQPKQKFRMLMLMYLSSEPDGAGPRHENLLEILTEASKPPAEPVPNAAPEGG